MGAGSGGMRPLRRGARLIGLDPVLPAEALDPARGVHELLLPREERMAIRADFDVDDLFHGGARLDHVAAHANDGRVVVAGMDVLLHGRFTPLLSTSRTTTCSSSTGTSCSSWSGSSCRSGIPSLPSDSARSGTCAGSRPCSALPVS